MIMREKAAATRLRPLLSLGVLAGSLVPLLAGASTAQPAANPELKAAVACVIAAWNAYDAGAMRRCYVESAVAVWNGQRRAIDWEFERRLRAFDAAAHARFRYEILDAQYPNVEFTLYETNQLIDALGLERVTVRWRYTVRGGRVVEEQLLKQDSAFSNALRQFTQWGRNQRPDGWTSVTDRAGSLRFDGATAPTLIGLARKWARSRGPG